MAEAEDEGLELFLRRRFPGQEQLIQTWVAKLASEGFVSLTGLKAASFQQVRELGLPLAFAIRLDDEGYLSSSQPQSLQPRTFYSGDAISLDKHYYCPWPDFDGLVADIISGNWLLLTGPWQSGKTSLLHALGLAFQERGYLVLLTTLDDLMVELGSNRKKDELSAAGDFYTRLANKVCDAAGNELQRPAGMVESVVDMFKVPEGGKFRDVIWLVDEAQLLNRIYHETGYAVHQLLSSLREAKRDSVYRLHSFCLCGLPELSALIGDARTRRAMNSEGPYVPSSPQDVYDPLRPQLSGWSPPLSKQAHRDVWKLDEQQVAAMILDYAGDRTFFFKMSMDVEADGDKHRQAVSAISKDIVERTSGHIGLVGSCCSFLQKIDHEVGMEVRSFEHWLKLARRGRLRSHVFTDTAYGKMVRMVAQYPDRVKSVILACIDSLDGSADVSDLDTVLEAIADGVLEECGTLQVRFTSPLLLSTILESCKFASLQVVLASTESLMEVYETAITLMNPDVFLRPRVLNVSGQPSEYLIQSQLFRSLMFLMERGVYTHKYNVFVEVKERDENGVRTNRMDGYMENARAPKQGLEIEVGKGRNVRETRKTVKDHLERSVYYKELHSCEMNYMYFWVRDGDADSDATGARLVMEELRDSFSGMTCWYVNYMPGERAWTIERLKDDGKWVTMRKNVAPEFPRFLLSSLDAGKRCNF